MKIYLFDTTETHENLLPLSFTRPVACFRCGIMTIKEKWERRIPGDYGYYPVEYLRGKFGTVENDQEEALFIAGNVMPDSEICDLILHLNNGEGLTFEGNLIAYRSALAYPKDDLKKKEISGKPDVLKYVFDIFLQNGSEIKKDFEVLTKGRKSEPLPDCVRLVNKTPKGEERKDIFIEEGATVECTTINTKSGPVYVGKGAVLMEGSCIRGPFAICEESEVRMGTKIYEGTTVGPHCKVGGEISNTVFFGYSNKAHDGYLGNAVIGEWCNIGAGTNASNLKNDYTLIRVWNYATQSFMHTDLQFCGLIMGDHSKIGVNCMINTATVIGVGVNIHGSGFPRTFLPCFSEGSAVTGFSHVSLKKFLDTAERVMGRRDLKMSSEEENILRHIYDGKAEIGGD